MRVKSLAFFGNQIYQQYIVQVEPELPPPIPSGNIRDMGFNGRTRFSISANLNRSSRFSGRNRGFK